jgi:predicted glycoside hydrolase/deacetylase ChbG (UPF0249 family)
MLIVNADDCGKNRSVTDAMLECYARRRITSTSAMVFMEDSARAAEVALASGIEIGLHLNLSEAFSGRDVPWRLREDQDRVRRFLTKSKYALVVYHPLLAREFRDVCERQYAEFRRLYGRAPSHVDGHHHMHLASNVLFQRLLPRGAVVRRSFSFSSGERSVANRWYRAWVDRKLARRHRMCDRFLALSQHLSIERFRRVMLMAKRERVELMTHAQIAEEYRFLMSDAYGEAVAGACLSAHDAE